MTHTFQASFLVLLTVLAIQGPVLAETQADWERAARLRAEETAQQKLQAQLNWEYEQRRAAAHAVMPDTLYASTPISTTKGEFTCPVPSRRLATPEVSHLLERRTKGRSMFGVNGSAMNSISRTFRDTLSAFGAAAERPPSRTFERNNGVGYADHFKHTLVDGPRVGDPQDRNEINADHRVYMFPTTSDLAPEGLVRVINHSTLAGEVRIDPVDESGRRVETITLSIGANATLQLTSADLDEYRSTQGLSRETGTGQGAWWLQFASELDLEVLSYIRTPDGLLSSMLDPVPQSNGTHEVSFFHGAGDAEQTGKLRLINPGEETARITIRGVDDLGQTSQGEVVLSIEPGAVRELVAMELEQGALEIEGALGDGTGAWRLEIRSDRRIEVMNLLEGPNGHISNLSSLPAPPRDGVHLVPLFPSASDLHGRQGLLRVINQSSTGGTATIDLRDDSNWDHEPLTLRLEANAVTHLSSDDLEFGNAMIGLSGSAGGGVGDWRLEISSELELDVLSYVRHRDGLLTSTHDVVPEMGNVHRVSTFYSGHVEDPMSQLRLVNLSDEEATVVIAGTTDSGMPGTSEVVLTVPGNGVRTLTSRELEGGAEGLQGALGPSLTAWRLTLTADRPIVAMNLLQSAAGMLTNLSSAPYRSASDDEDEEETAESVFKNSISSIVQSKCVNCHAEGKRAENSRLVFVTEEEEGHVDTNLKVFEDFLKNVEDGGDVILDRVQGVGHDGGVQFESGSDEYTSMVKFLTLLGEEVDSAEITPDQLFAGVTMESARSTLRRAAIVFAGRAPTKEEYASIEDDDPTSLRSAIRGLMQGDAFHDFLIRAGNDRLLTDRRGTIIDANAGDEFVDFTNQYYEKRTSDISDEEFGRWENNVNYGIHRAPLELIAHVVKNDLPYTEVLTARYIMANSYAASAYGATTTFEDEDDVHEFKPSEIVSYYRDDNSKKSEFFPGLGTKVTNPGNLITDYPHAGILNTTVFLKRYPSTATNRNRARSRWTYYHFLGFDIEKSQSRATDPDALVDTDNPTMNNPACTKCHVALDPVAGAFQNYGDEGLYRDQPGGLDSLDNHYKRGTRETFFVAADSFESRQTFSLRAELDGDENLLVIEHPHNNGCGENGDESCGRDLRIDQFVVRDTEGIIVDRIEWSELDDHCEYDGTLREGPDVDDHYQWWGWECANIPVDIAEPATYVVELTAWADQAGDEVTWFRLGVKRYQLGDTWYRDMRTPGFDGTTVPDADASLQWLAEQIVADDRFAEATVKFYWPAIMGSEVAEPPEDKDDVDYQAQLLESNALTAEVRRLASGFREGFNDGFAYDAKDLLVEIVMSKWFRAESLSDHASVRARALRDAGAKRLLTAEELAHKTKALTDFEWGRVHGGNVPWLSVIEQRKIALTRSEGYGLLYGGIDSDGVTERTRDLTSVMAGVAQSHALESSCPIVMKEFYLLAEDERMLLQGVKTTTSPIWEFDKSFDVDATSWETLSLSGTLDAGEAVVTLSFLNEYRESTDVDRNIRLDRLDILDSDGKVILSKELEELKAISKCNYPEWDHFALHCSGALDVQMDIPETGEYVIEVVARADLGGNEFPRLLVSVGSDKERSAGSRLIKGKLQELYELMHGIEVSLESEEILGTYGLFVDVWNHKRKNGYGDFNGEEGLECNWRSDLHYLDGILDGVIVYREDWGDEWSARYRWDEDLIKEHFRTIEWSDTQGVARTWVVVLAYLLMDYRYLHL